MAQSNTSQALPKRYRLVQVGIYVLAVILGAIALTAVIKPGAILSAFPAQTPGIPTPIQNFYLTVITRLRIAGIVALIGVVVLIAVRHWLIPRLVQIGTDARQGLVNAADELRSFIRQEDRLHIAALLLILLLAIGLRAAFLFEPMRYDEADTFTTYASQPLIVGIADYAAPNNHIFHTLLVYVAYHLLGNQPWIIRLPAFLAGVLIIPAGYLLTRRLYDKHAALLAAGLLAASSYLVQYATDARGYSLVALIFLLLLIVSLSLLNGGKGWAGFVILTTLGFYTVPVMVYPFGTVAVWLLASLVLERQWATVKNFVVATLAAAGLTLALYTPAFAISGIGAVVGNQYVKPLAWTAFFAQIGNALGDYWMLWNRDWPRIVTALLVIGCILGIVWSVRRSSLYRIPLIISAAVWCIPVILVQRVVPYSRVWLFLLPVYLITAAIGLRFALSLILNLMKPGQTYPMVYAGLSIGLLAVGMVGVLSSRSPYFADETGFFPEAEPVAAFLKDYLQPGDHIYAGTPTKAQVIYYGGRLGIPRSTFSSDAPHTNFDQRVLVVVDTRALPIGQMIPATFPDGSPTVPKLVMEYQSAQVYQIQHRSVSEIF